MKMFKCSKYKVPSEFLLYTCNTDYMCFLFYVFHNLRRTIFLYAFYNDTKVPHYKSITINSKIAF